MRDIRKTILLTSTRSYIVILGYITWTSIVHEDRGVAGEHIVRVDVGDGEVVGRAVLDGGPVEANYGERLAG